MPPREAGGASRGGGGWCSPHPGPPQALAEILPERRLGHEVPGGRGGRCPVGHPRWETRPEMISQCPPGKEEDPIRHVG